MPARTPGQLLIATFIMLTYMLVVVYQHVGRIYIAFRCKVFRKIFRCECHGHWIDSTQWNDTCCSSLECDLDEVVNLREMQQRKKNMGKINH